ncbi:MarR family transcriptional regulator [Nocardioides sp. GY 10127]|nr:MarR family transcriptional regulator [Nocardioides sp. GY 10127]TIC81136.1 MarR family transcriptional regulator [Nocardioides sp. GY 10127]
MSAARSLRRAVWHSAGEWDVAPAQAKALGVVCREAPVRISRLAERLHIAPRSATEVVDHLQERGLVLREPDPVDRRATCVVPTEEGRRLQALLAESRRQATEGYLAVLDDEERAVLDRLVRRLVLAERPERA